MSLTETPRSGRLHLGVFGRGNAGKSSLMNALTGHSVAIVADQAGTTTDPIYKSMEIHPLGPCVLIDTAGFDDSGQVGSLRVEKTAEALDKTDVGLLVLTQADLEEANQGVVKSWVDGFKQRHTPYLAVLNKIDLLNPIQRQEVADSIRHLLGKRPVLVSAATGEGLDSLLEGIMRLVPEDWDSPSITGGLVKEDDVVLLVMPQDIQAPKGRLILPQVQTIRELLDKKCVVMSVTTDKLDTALRSLARPPHLIITDSQAFPQVYAKKPEESLLTSFSILMAKMKGDIHAFVAGAAALGNLTETSRVLIAEACTHAPLAEDIGREKIPAMLRKRVGPGLTVEVVSGTDFPQDLTPYDVIIHCGACMFNRKYMLSRIQRAQEHHIPITNYGVTLAWLGGILNKIELG